jgi:hypothetical protein
VDAAVTVYLTLTRSDSGAGGMLRAPRAALIPVLDLLHHHGQICYLQTLLGDREQHWNEAAIAESFGRDSAEPPA